MDQMQFPCWMYHADTPQGRVFADAAEFAESGDGWVDSPAKIGMTPEIEQQPETAPVKRGPGRPRKVL